MQAQSNLAVTIQEKQVKNMLIHANFTEMNDDTL